MEDKSLSRESRGPGLSAGIWCCGGHEAAVTRQRDMGWIAGSRFPTIRLWYSHQVLCRRRAMSRSIEMICPIHGRQESRASFVILG